MRYMYLAIYLYNIRYSNMKSIKGLRNFLIIPIYLTFLSIFPVCAQDVQLLDVTINEAKAEGVFTVKYKNYENSY